MYSHIVGQIKFQKLNVVIVQHSNCISYRLNGKEKLWPKVKHIKILLKNIKEF